MQLLRDNLSVSIDKRWENSYRRTHFGLFFQIWTAEEPETDNMNSPENQE